MSYTRVCTQCGSTAEVGYKPKGTERCLKCSSSELGANLHKLQYPKDYKYITYWYFCTECSDVAERPSSRKSTWCGKCNRKFSKSKHQRDRFEFSFITMTTVCTFKYVKPKQKSYYVPKPRIKKEPKKKKKARYIDPKAVEKVREQNRVHREAQKPIEIIPQAKTDEDMIAEWLEQNKIKDCNDSRYKE